MKGNPVCSEFRSRGAARAYAAHALSLAEAAAFEEHMVTCDRCQSDVVLEATIPNALRAAAVERTTWKRRVWIGAIAASIAGTWLVARERSMSPGIRQLGGVAAAPKLEGVPVRAVSRPAADTLFAIAMNAYTTGRYSAAERGLRAALGAGVDTVATQFFRGASLLMLNRPTDAETVLQQVIAAGESPWQDDARYYRAKALLRLGRTDAALMELRTLAQAGADSALARALADSIASWRQR